MRNKKILHIVDKYGFGGVETIIYQLIEKFKQKNTKTYYLFLRDRKFKKKIKKKNIFIEDFKKFDPINPLKKIKKIINEKKINTIHTHSRKGFYLAYLLGKIFKKIKFIHHEHGDILQKNPIYSTVFRLFSKRINLVIAVSKTAKKKLIEKAKINPKKIKVLYNFVDLERFSKKNIKINVNKEKKKLKIKPDEFAIGFVGRLAKIKGCEDLIKSLPSLEIKYKVLIAGDGPEKRKLKKLAKNLKVEDKIIFLGYINKPERIYPLLDVLVMPSLSEASPMSLYEAFAMEIPVIARKIPQFEEYIFNEKNGLLFKNQKELINNIKRLKKDEKLFQKIRKKSLESSKLYRLDKFMKSLKEMY